MMHCTLTETFLTLLASVDHPNEQMAFPAEYCINSHFELDVAVENVKWSLTENYPML